MKRPERTDLNWRERLAFALSPTDMGKSCAENQSTRIGEGWTFLPSSLSFWERSCCLLHFSRGAALTSSGTPLEKNTVTNFGIRAAALIEEGNWTPGQERKPKFG